MLRLILINAQYLQNVVFSFEKDSNGQNRSLYDSHHPIKNPPTKLSIPLTSTGENPLPLNTI